MFYHRYNFHHPVSLQAHLFPENVGFRWGFLFCFVLIHYTENRKFEIESDDSNTVAFRKITGNLCKCTKLHPAIATFIFDSFIFPTKVSNNKRPSSEILNITFGESIWGTLSMRVMIYLLKVSVLTHFILFFKRTQRTLSRYYLSICQLSSIKSIIPLFTKNINPNIKKWMKESSRYLLSKMKVKLQTQVSF